MTVRRGEIWWANLPEPRGSEPGYRRPVLVIQSDYFNLTAISTVLVAIITSNLVLAGAPGNVVLLAQASGLSRDSVVNVSQLMTLDRRYLAECVGALTNTEMAPVARGLRMAMDL